MKKLNNHYSFLAIGETTTKPEFKRYVGLGESYPVALNPTKEELANLYGKEPNYEVEYFGTDDGGVKWARLDFIMKTKPEVCNGADIMCRASFIIRNEKYYNNDKTKVRVIDAFGNSVWMSEEDANARKVPYDKNGNPKKIGEYRIARKGEPELCDFLRKFINTPDAFDYADRIWSPKKLKHISELTKEEAEKGKTLTYEQCTVSLDKEDFEAFFKGDTSSLWKLIKARMETNKTLGIKLLYGIKTKEDNKQSQVICTGYDMMLYKNATANALAKLEKNIADAKAARMYANIDYRVQDIQEYNVEPTNLEKPVASQEEMPWD